MAKRTNQYDRLFQRHLEDRMDYLPHEDPDSQGLTFEPHQREANRKILYGLRQQNREALSVVASCGSGKTAVEINLICASQQAKEDLGINGKRKDILVTVGRVPVKGIRKQFNDLGFETGVWSGGDRDLEPSIIVAGVHAIQMAHARRELRKLLPPGTIDLLVVDEADCFLTNARERLMQTLDPRIKVALTATPDWPDGRSTTDVFGPHVDRLDLRDGIMRGVNARPELLFYESEIKEEDLRVRKGDYDPATLQAAWKHAEVHMAIPEVYEHIIGQQDRKKYPTLIYVPSVKLVQATTETMQEMFGDHINVVGWNGEDTTTREMHRDMEAFNDGEVQVLVLCEMGGRGMNLENAMVLIDAYPTMSLNKLTQRHGRVLRKIREGSSLWEKGWRKNKALIAQIVPKSLKFRPALFTDILGGYQQYQQLREGDGGGSSGPPTEDPIDILRRRIEGRNPPNRVSLIRRIDALEAIRMIDELPQADRGGFFRLPRRYGRPGQPPQAGGEE